MFLRTTAFRTTAFGNCRNPFLAFCIRCLFFLVVLVCLVEVYPLIKEGGLSKLLVLKCLLSPTLLPSARKRLQMKIWGFIFAFAFEMERQIHSLSFSFAFTLVMIMLGTHKPQQQATLTKRIKIPELSLTAVIVL